MWFTSSTKERKGKGKKGRFKSKEQRKVKRLLEMKSVVLERREKRENKDEKREKKVKTREQEVLTKRRKKCKPRTSS